MELKISTVFCLLYTVYFFCCDLLRSCLMITPEQFDHYFFKVQELACCALDQQSRNALLDFIKREKDKCLSSPYGDFFEGEYAFYSGQYKNALKYYIQAQSIPYFKLFCYRASAYVSKGADDISKAVEFAEKAQRVFPDDYSTLVILEELLTQDDRNDAAQGVRNKIQDLEIRFGAPFTSPKKRMELIENFNLMFENSSSTASEDSTEILKPQAFTPNGPLESTVQQTLMQNLYASNISQSAPFVRKTTFEEQKPLFEPQKQKAEVPFKLPVETISLPKNSSENSLASKIRDFHQQQQSKLDHYLATWQTRAHVPDNSLFSLFGWNTIECHQDHSFLLPKPSGGYFVRWNGKGIVINPGRNFLTFFHQQGLHIRDIHYVIVTNDNPDSYVDVYEIYRLLFRLNQTHAELQVVHYYFVPKVFQAINSVLKSNFKQERNNVHALELFVDSPNIEHTALSEEIKLSYFPLLKNSKDLNGSPLGIHLELKTHADSVHIGYVSEAPWSSEWVKYLVGCNVVIAGFGETSLEDSMQTGYHEKSLGFFGTLSLLEASQPQVLLCSEFSGNDGDIRLEVVKLLREEMRKKQIASVIMPADPSLELDLHTLRAPCTISKMSVNVADMAITQSAQAFGTLQFLSPYCCIR